MFAIPFFTDFLTCLSGFDRFNSFLRIMQVIHRLFRIHISSLPLPLYRIPDGFSTTLRTLFYTIENLTPPIFRIIPGYVSENYFMPLITALYSADCANPFTTSLRLVPASSCSTHPAKPSASASRYRYSRYRTRTMSSLLRCLP